MEIIKTPHEFENNELINAIKGGDRNAFDKIYDLYWREMYVCAYKIFGNRETSEDIVHDVFLNLWIKREKLNIRSLRDYLYVSIKNRSLNKLRTHKTFSSLEDQRDIISPEKTDSPLSLKELNSQFENFTLSLPKKCNEIINLSRKEQLSNKEIAKKLNISTKTVENQINYALKRLRILIKSTASIFFLFFL